MFNFFERSSFRPNYVVGPISEASYYIKISAHDQRPVDFLSIRLFLFG